MPDRIKRYFARFSTALGAAAAFFGVRALLRWSERRAQEKERLERVTNRMMQPTTAASRQPRDQPDRQPVPATGSVGGATVAADLASAGNQPVEEVALQTVVAPLTQYLLAFNELIELLRSRRGAEVQPGARTLSADDRAGFQETLDRLERLIPDFGPGNLQDDSLQARAYRLMVKARDALQNRDYGDDDLFRINGELRSETCRMLAELQWAGADRSPEFEQVRQAYDCG